MKKFKVDALSMNEKELNQVYNSNREHDLFNLNDIYEKADRDDKSVYSENN